MKVAAITHQLRCLISFKSILDNLRDKIKNLQDKRKKVEEILTWDSEEFQTHSSWLKRVDDIFQQVDAFLNYYEGNSACTNLLWRYHLCKQARKMTQEISQLHEENEFYQSVKLAKGYKGSKSRADTINEIMVALKDPQIPIVGVWALGGVGTTSLVKQVGEQAKEQNLFDVVVMFTLTEKPNVQQIQRDIAATLGLQFHGENHVEGRNRLRQRIKKEEKILVVVDDIWGELNAQEIDFEEFGIPFGDEHKGCKLLLTSGNLDFIKYMRGDPKIFQLEVLLEDEALTLFKKMVGGIVSDSEASSIVNEIVKSCIGSTLSTFVLAKVLRNKSLDAWQKALMQLKDNVSPMEICYYNLESKELKYFLLLLTMRGRRAIDRYNIYIDMWTGLFKNIGTSEDARKRMDSLISDLKAYGLVVEEGKEQIKIADLIWETAYLMAQKDLKASIISGKWPPEEWLRNLHFCNMIIMHGLQVPERLQCPKLQEIVLRTQSPSMLLPNPFFEETKLLKVLEFIGFVCSKLPVSIGLLKNLQALSLCNCKLEDITIVGELTNLRMLSLFESPIEQLPRQIGQLQKLLFLDLRDTYLQVIPPNVLSNLTSLEELYLRNSFCNWKVEGSKNENNNAILKELKNLHHLAYIEDLYIPDHRALPVDLFFENLKSYTIFIGDIWGKTHDGDHGLKTLKLKLTKSFQLNDGIKKMLKNVDILYLDEFNGVQNVLDDLESDGFPYLQSLIVQQNAKIKCIAMSSSHPLDAFPNLESLSLNNLSDLEFICHGPLTKRSFSKIRVIKLQKCHGMTCLFSYPMIESLPHIVDIEISECKHIESIVKNDGETHLEFPQLRSLTLRELPTLVGFHISYISHLTSALFNPEVSFPNLETLIISGAHKLKCIWEYDDHNSYEKLKNVDITDCANLWVIFYRYNSTSFPNLKNLIVRNCHSMAFILYLWGPIDKQLIQLIHITLVQLPVLEFVCGLRLPVPIEFPEMDSIYLEDLPKFKRFSDEFIVELPFLKNVVVNHCPSIQRGFLGKIENSQLKSFIIENQEQVNNDAQVARLFDLASDPFSMIAEYNIDGNEELSRALDNIKYSHFTNLIRFRAKNCDGRRLRELLEILDGRSYLLEYLTIEKCDNLWFISEVKFGGNYLMRIKELVLMELPQLNNIWPTYPRYYHGFKLHNLEKIHVKSCPELEDLITPIVEELPKLNELKIEDCKMLKQVVSLKPKNKQRIVFRVRKVELVSMSTLIMFHDDDYALEFPVLENLTIEECPNLEAFTTDKKSFSELKELKLDSCDKLVHVISSNTLQEFGNLNKLTLSHCNALKIVFKIQGEISHSTKPFPLQQLSELNLTDLPNLIYIINNQSTRFYQNLLILRVKQCKSLNWLAGSIMLTNMEISDSEVLEKIIIMEKGEVTAKKTIFSQLKYVSLANLTKVSTFFPIASEFPSLETLIIANCPALTTFVEDSLEVKDPSIPVISNYFFPISLSLEKLKVLYVINQNVEKLWHYNCPSKSFCELETMNLSGNNKLLSVISSKMMIRYNNLKTLIVHKCGLLTVVFNLENENPDQNIKEMLPQLRVLVLSNLSNLTQIWSKEPEVPFFQNLVSLHIVHCGNLKSVFSLSTAKYLRQLKLFKVYSCKEMNEVISGNEEENVPITFPEVECLTLKDLPNLTSFYPQSETFNWPKLQTLRVSNIPHMKTFVGGHLNTPLLRTVYTTFVKKCWHGNLNKTITYLHENTGKKGM